MRQDSPFILAFAARLRAARELRQWTQRDLAARAGVPKSGVAHFERGTRRPSVETLHRLASALDTSTDYLLGRIAVLQQPVDADPLVREFGNLNGADRDLARDFVRMLMIRHQLDRTVHRE